MYAQCPHLVPTCPYRAHTPKNTLKLYILTCFLCLLAAVKCCGKGDKDRARASAREKTGVTRTRARVGGGSRAPGATTRYIYYKCMKQIDLDVTIR